MTGEEAYRWERSNDHIRQCCHHNDNTSTQQGHSWAEIKFLWPEGEPPFFKIASLLIIVESVCFTANNCSCCSKDDDGEPQFDPVKAFASLEVFGFLFIRSVRRGRV